MNKKIFLLLLFFTGILLFNSPKTAAAQTLLSCGAEFYTGDDVKCPDECPPMVITGTAEKFRCIKSGTQQNTINNLITPSAGTNTNNGGQICNPALNAAVGCNQQGEDTIAKIMAVIIRVFFIIGSIAVLLYLLIGGLQWITAGGDKNALENARNHITSAFIGIVIIAGSFAIIMFLGNLLDIEFFKTLTITWPTITP